MRQNRRGLRRGVRVGAWIVAAAMGVQLLLTAGGCGDNQKKVKEHQRGLQTAKG